MSGRKGPRLIVCIFLAASNNIPMGRKQWEVTGQFEVYAFGKEGIVCCIDNGLLLLSSFIGNIIIANHLSIGEPRD